MTRHPFSLVVSRPPEMTEEGYQYAATLVQREAYQLGLDVEVMPIVRPEPRPSHRPWQWPFRGTR